MVSELAILNLQVLASALMGYDYFLSDSLKEHANVAARDYVRAEQNFLDEKLRAQTTIFFKVLPVLLSGTFFAMMCWASVYLMKVVGESTGSLWGVLALALIAMVFLFGAMKGLMDGITEGGFKAQVQQRGRE